MGRKTMGRKTMGRKTIHASRAGKSNRTLLNLAEF